MVNTRSPASCRTQRASSVAAETRRTRDEFYISSEFSHTAFPPPLPSPSKKYAYSSLPIPNSTTATSQTASPQSVKSSAPRFDASTISFFDLQQFHRSSLSPSATAEQKKEARAIQQQRREQIVQKLQQQQIDAKEKERQEKLEKQQARMERKHQRNEYKQMYQEMYDRSNPDHHHNNNNSKDKNSRRNRSRDSKDRRQFSLPIETYNPDELPSSSHHHLTDAQLYASNQTFSHQHQYQHDQDNLSSSSSSTKSRSSSHHKHGHGHGHGHAPDRMRSLSLKSTTKSMYDLRPWSEASCNDLGSGSGANQHSPTHDQYYYTGYDSDENATSVKSHGWDTLMDTLYSPTLSSPSDTTISSDSKEDPDLDVLDSMSALTLSHEYDNGNGNGKYLLERVLCCIMAMRWRTIDRTLFPNIAHWHFYAHTHAAFNILALAVLILEPFRAVFIHCHTKTCSFVSVFIHCKKEMENTHPIGYILHFCSQMIMNMMGMHAASNLFFFILCLCITAIDGEFIIVLGANGRTGIELVKQGLERNYRVTAFVRDDRALLEDSSLRKNQNLIIVRGSPTSQADIDRCVEGQDVVVNVIGARLMTNDTTIGSHSQVVLNNALKKHGVRRLIVVTSYGCLGLRSHLINTKRLFSRMFMTGILKDKVLQEDIIQRDSEYLDWTIVRPVTLKDGELSNRYHVSTEELPKNKNKIKVLSRKDLAHYILTIINRPEEYKTIRSIAGKPKPSKACHLCPFEKRREAQELAKHQEYVKIMQEKGIF